MGLFALLRSNRGIPRRCRCLTGIQEVLGSSIARSANEPKMGIHHETIVRLLITNDMTSSQGEVIISDPFALQKRDLKQRTS